MGKTMAGAVWLDPEDISIRFLPVLEKYRRCESRRMLITSYIPSNG